MEKDKGRMAFLDLLINVLREHEKKMDEQLIMAKDIVELLEGFVDRGISFKAMDPQRKKHPWEVRVLYPKKKPMDTKRIMELFRILENFFGEGYPG